MNKFTIELTDLELRGLEYVSLTAIDWITNAVKERCRLAVEELVQDTIKTTLESGGALAGTKEEIALGSTLPSAADRNASIHANFTHGQTPNGF